MRWESGENLYIKLDAFPDAYKYRAITNLTPYIYATGFDIETSGARGKLEFAAVTEAFDIDKVTFATRPSDSTIGSSRHISQYTQRPTSTKFETYLSTAFLPTLALILCLVLPDIPKSLM